MTNFEQLYYEADQFWSDDVLQDEMNTRRVILTAGLIPKECKSLLDAGCGNGMFVNHLIDHNSTLEKIVAVDRSETALKRVRSEKRVADIAKLPFDDAEFDCVTSLEVIEHLPHNIYGAALSEIARVSSKYVIISVPYNEKLSQNVTQCPSCRTIFNIDLHLRSFDETKMQNLLSDKGLECVHQEVFFPFKRNIGATYLYRLENKKKFNSPICPVCGLENGSFVSWSPARMQEHINNPSLSNRIRQVLKKIWIKKTVKGLWIIGVYKKSI